MKTPSPVKFRLGTADLESSTWRRIAKRLDERISTLQRQLEAPQTEASTCELRGRIAELRLLASAAEEELPPIVS